MLARARREADRLVDLAQSEPGSPAVAALAERVRRLHEYARQILDAHIGPALALACGAGAKPKP